MRSTPLAAAGTAAGGGETSGVTRSALAAAPPSAWAPWLGLGLGLGLNPNPNHNHNPNPNPNPNPNQEAHWASRLISRGGTGGYTRLVEAPNSPHHLGAYSPTRGEVTSGHVGRGVSSADTAAAKRDARRLRRARVG